MKKQNHRFLVGAHMPISGGLEHAIEYGLSLGCTTIQLFTKSNRQWRAKPIDEAAAHRFKAAAKESGIAPIVVHASYLINIASTTPQTATLSRHALVEEIARCELLDVPYLVLHPGSYGSSSPSQGIDRIIEGLNECIKKEGTTMVLLELMAGQGSVLGDSFEQLATILRNVDHPKKVGVCFDTCHAFSAGYDLRTPSAYKATWAAFDKQIGLEHLKVIHLNDSKKELGSHVDRHEHIGKGHLGLEAFKLLVNDPAFFDIPKILETPKATKPPFTEDKMNLETLHKLLSPTTRKLLHVNEK